MTPTAKILVIRGGAIGDFVLTLPVLAAMRSQFPAIHLEVLGYPRVANLAMLDGTVDAVKPIEARALAGFFAAGGTLDPEWVRYFGEFALIVSYLYDPDQIFKSNVQRCTAAQYITGPHRPVDEDASHAVDVLLKPLESLAIFSPDPIPQIRLNPPKASPSPGSVALHPGSGSERKNWPESKWKEFCRLLIDQTPHDLLLISGEAEGQKAYRLQSQITSERVKVAHGLPLTDLSRTLVSCHSFVGHDSGISHLAGALGLEALLLWGDTNPDVWRPRNPKVTVYQHPAGLLALPAAKVFELWREWTR